MRFSHQAMIDLPVEAINLHDWLFTLSQADYSSCAHGHRAIGMLGGAQRTGMVNVESIGGSLLIQHYATRLAEKDHVTMLSETSRAYIMHIVPVKCGVIWDMQTRAAGQGRTLFECTIDVTLPAVVRLLGYTIGTPVFIRRHLVEETHGFAKNIARRFG